MGFELHYANENYSDGYVSKITSFRDFLEESIATQQSTVQSKNVDANRQGSGNNCTVSKSFERAKLLSFKSCGEEIDNTPPMGLNSHNYSYMLDFLCEDSQYKSVYMRSLKVCWRKRGAWITTKTSIITEI
ncbi:unnamed protein product, partial [Mesorhabditis belari]|uniref:Uncharacterized protein n=1 Tax=Mesorhabditis belari TaxID=2138241 RepID=A0AAF3JBH6_9BILA